MKPSILPSGRQAVALTIAGSDSGGNAGVQADIRAFHTFGVHACTVFSALTAQNPRAVTAVQVADDDFLRAQLDAVLPVYTIGAAKTGMLPNRSIIEITAEKLKASASFPVIVDPVMIATSGAKLIQDDAIEAMRSCMLPVAALATPNCMEAEVLSGIKITSLNTMLEAGKKITEAAGCAVLVKGGHFSAAPALDLLLLASGEIYLFRTSTIENPVSTHGTGCSLSAAIAAALAARPDIALQDAVFAGKAYIFEAIRSAVYVGPEAGVLGMPDVPDLFSHPEITCERLA